MMNKKIKKFFLKIIALKVMEIKRKHLMIMMKTIDLI